MAEYIERDELLKFKADVYDEDGHVLYAVPTGYIVAMPSADVAPVRHGRIVTTIDRWAVMHQSCSECGSNLPWNEYPNYCFNCGVKLDLEET